jgi:hypothetical protein
VFSVKVAPGCWLRAPVLAAPSLFDVIFWRLEVEFSSRRASAACGVLAMDLELLSVISKFVGVCFVKLGLYCANF